MPEAIVPTIYVRATRQQARNAIAALPAMLAGRRPDPTGQVRVLQLAAGLQALGIIKKAFYLAGDALGIMYFGEETRRRFVGIGIRIKKKIDDTTHWRRDDGYTCSHRLYKRRAHTL